MGLRVGLISTIHTNIGDDLIRDGIVRTIGETLGTRCEYRVINKHDPLTILGRTNPARLVRLLPNRGRDRHRVMREAGRHFGHLTRSRFHGLDLIVQCGTPQFWPGCRFCEWSPAIWEASIGRLPKATPVLNLAAGSCYAWHAAGDGLSLGKDEAYVRMLTRLCDVMVVRDRLAADIVSSVGGSPILLPCAAFVSGPAVRPDLLNGSRGHVVVNYMARAGHFAFAGDRAVDPNRWRATMAAFVRQVKERRDVVLLCHSDDEARLARDVAPGTEVVFPRDARGYHEVAEGAVAGVVNRLHAAVALAGRGVPCVAIGTDTRLLMVEELGLPARFAPDVTTESLLEDLDRLLETRVAESQRLLKLRTTTRDRYADIVRGAIA